jgi:hypothetical protein
MIDSYDKLTIGKYKEVKAIIDAKYDEIQTNIELVSVLTDMHPDDVEDLPLGTFNRLLQSTAFLMEEPKQRLVATRYKLGKYDLDVVMDLKKLTVAQYIDYQNYLKDIERYLVEIISVFLIPKGMKYCEGYDVADVQRVIEENMSIIDALSLSAFFLTLYQSLTKATLTYLKRKMRWMKMMTWKKEERKKLQEVIANLESVGNGLPQLTGLAKR